MATKPETEETLQKFYTLVRPAALGWSRFASETERQEPTLRYNFYHWVLGFTLVYSMLFGVGNVLFERYGMGIGMIVLSLACLAVLFRSLERRGWSVFQ